MKKPAERPVNQPGHTRTRSRAGAVLGRAVLFIALTAVILSFGMVAGTPGARDAPRTFSETALTEARASARSLAAEARVLAEGASGRTAAELEGQMNVLQEQAALLAGPGRDTGSGHRSSTEEPLFPSGAASEPAAGRQAVDSPDAETQAAERYLRQLAASARTSLHSAWRADAGTARLLASTGAAQQVLAERTADLYALDVPEAGPDAGLTGTSAAPAGAGTAASKALNGSDSSGKDCPDQAGSGTVAVAPEKVDAAAALNAVIDAELGTAYAYEVALAQDPQAGEYGAEWRRLAQAHEAGGTAAVPFLADVCLPVVAPVAAYRLDGDFLQDPAGSLPLLEERLPSVYADLVALSEGALRGWAISRLGTVSTDLYRDAEAVPAAPGLAAVPDDLPWN
ncbi:DUF4439 domain-containing protein [Arthrobacter sp. YD2]|uniref:DUF4439 domain-containing protein n=1 Tax=Arthrobacter sp. YD2 TaxID=3058046 RepID=UPI0025B556EB|nr:DUF4439 domain-containing protein [Arthrobacter sp. YD2]MDN3905120.1 DUF4439 domain-containing protein [Arthrobacter sp. YD2]